jgi:hypothetical protein
MPVWFRGFCHWGGFFVLLAALGSGLPLRAADPFPDSEAPEVLTDAHLNGDAASLLAFFRQRTLLAADRDRLVASIPRLGDASFAVREQATADLLAGGPASLPFLRAALTSSDAEIVRRARRCLETIEEGPGPVATEVAVRLLARQKPTGAVEALLAYLPFAEDDGVEQAILVTLADVAIRNGRADAAITAALTDREPARRAAAAFVLARAPQERRRPVLLALLRDHDPKVRFEASVGLVALGEKSAVPVLTALLSEAPPLWAWRAERFLVRLAGEKAPALALQATESSRRRTRAAWEEWWRTSADQIALAGPWLDAPVAGWTLVADLDEGQLLALGPDHKSCWQLDDLAGPVDVQSLPSGRLLIAENHGQRVTERALSGKIVWQKKIDALPLGCWRELNGNTLIITRETLLEVNPDGKEVRTVKWVDPVWSACRLRNGRISLLTVEGDIVTVTPTGEELHRFRPGDKPAEWSSLTVLWNGHYLVAGCAGGKKVVEFDRHGRQLWDCDVGGARSAARLPNGNTLICVSEDRRVVELDRGRKVVGERRTQGRPWHVQVLP